VRTFCELDAWRLSDELRKEIEAIIASPAARRDEKVCNQIRGAAGSVCTNIAEGFGRYWPSEHHRFLVIAQDSRNTFRRNRACAILQAIDPVGAGSEPEP
jgi:four helix bundle protein